MKRMITLLLLTLCLQALVMEALHAEVRTRRYSIIVGANNGGPGRQQLRYAVSDARSMQNVMNRMGGVDRGDSTLLIEPGRESFFAAINSLNRMVSRDRGRYKRVEVLFYYSGHSDEEAILINRDRIYYREIRQSLQAIPADLHMAILDSCSSGAFTRAKGGVMRSPFLVDSSYDMKGYAFMTSSSDREASQESDRIGGSFFTHYLVSGLRGAADMSRDGRVTISEAYQYAYNETLAQTEKTMSGPQHPYYNIVMTGTGDVVMTDIRKSSSSLVLDKSLKGRIVIRDGSNSLVAEISKTEGRELALGLEGGTYTVTSERDGVLYEGIVALRTGSRSTIDASSMKSSSREITFKRGDEKKTLGEYERVFFTFQFLPDFGGYPRIENAIALHFFAGSHTRVNGLASGLGVSFIREDIRGAQISLIGNVTGGDARWTQLAVIFNYAGGEMKGLQASYVYNVAAEDMTGCQLAYVFNWAGGAARGFQCSSVFNYASSFQGWQAGIVNITAKGMQGLQTSLVNVVRDEADGAQLGLVNVAGDTRGGQASLVNVAGNTTGIQAGLFNWSGDITGGQAGLFNFAGDVTGAQVGLLNVSRNMKGIPLGLVNIIRNGVTDFDLTADETGFFSVGIRHGTENLYVLYLAGAEFSNSPGSGTGSGSVALGLGYGYRHSWGDLALCSDISASYLDYTGEEDDAGALRAQLRCFAVWKALGPVKIIGGLSFNYAFIPDSSGVRTGPFFRTFDHDDTHAFWPGVFVGVSY